MAKVKKGLADLAFLVMDSVESIEKIEKVEITEAIVIKEKVAVKNGMTYRCKEGSVWIPSGMYGDYISDEAASQLGYEFFDSIEDYLASLPPVEPINIHGEGHAWIDDQGVEHWSQGMLFRQRY